MPRQTTGGVRRTFKERENWILARLTDEISGVDVLNANFVQDYLEFCGEGTPFYPMPYGAHKVPQLGRDLSRMFRESSLTRTRIGLDNMAGMGFPNWVYNYRIAPRWKEIARMEKERLEVTNDPHS